MVPDSSSGPTVYERVEVSGHEGAKQRQVVPPEENRESSGWPVVAAGVTRVGEADNGLAATSLVTLERSYARDRTGVGFPGLALATTIPGCAEPRSR